MTVDVYEVLLYTERAPGKWRRACRWPHSREAVAIAEWAAQLCGGRRVIAHRKEWDV